MANTKNAPQVAQVDNEARKARKARKANASAQAQPQAQVQAPTNAPTSAPAEERKELSKGEQSALRNERVKRAQVVAEHIRAEAASISGVLRNMYECAMYEGDHAYSANMRDIIRADIESILGKEAVSTALQSRKAFSTAWLSILRKYATACDESGVYVTLRPYAGMLEAVEFVPTLKALYVDIVRHWVQGATPLRVKRGAWYKRVGSGKNATLECVPRDEARKVCEAYETRQAVAKEGARRGRESALRVYDGKQAALNA